MRSGILLVFIAAIGLYSCSQDNLTNRVSKNLTGKWVVKSASLRKWDRKTGEKPVDKNELNGETYEFYPGGNFLKRNKQGDSARAGKIKIQASDRSNYNLHVSYVNADGELEDKEFWEILNGRGSKMIAYIENGIGELKLELEKI